MVRKAASLLPLFLPPCYTLSFWKKKRLCQQSTEAKQRGDTDWTSGGFNCRRSSSQSRMLNSDQLPPLLSRSLFPAWLYRIWIKRTKFRCHPSSSWWKVPAGWPTQCLPSEGNSRACPPNVSWNGELFVDQSTNSNILQRWIKRCSGNMTARPQSAPGASELNHTQRDWDGWRGLMVRAEETGGLCVTGIICRIKAGELSNVSLSSHTCH